MVTIFVCVPLTFQGMKARRNSTDTYHVKVFNNMFKLDAYFDRSKFVASGWILMVREHFWARSRFVFLWLKITESKHWTALGNNQWKERVYTVHKVHEALITKPSAAGDKWVSGRSPQGSAIFWILNIFHF